MSGLPARTGWTWLKEGARLFRKQSGALTSLLFANALIFLLIVSIPLLGQIVAFALMPSLSMSFMAACLLVEHGQRVSPSVLLTGLRKPALAQLIKLGFVYLGFALLLFGLFWLMVSAELIAQFKTPLDMSKLPVVMASDKLVVLGLGLLNLAGLLLICYAAALVHWQKMGIGKALFFSLVGVLRSAGAFVVLLVAAFGILSAAQLVITLILGTGTVGSVVVVWLMFLYLLILQCAVFCGYRQIFGVPALGASTS